MDHGGNDRVLGSGGGDSREGQGLPCLRGTCHMVQMVAASLRATRCSKEGIYWLALKKKGETKPVSLP